MSTPLSYSHEKLAAAVCILAGPGTQESRVIDALAYQLLYLDETKLTTPDTARRFQQIMDAASAREKFAKFMDTAAPDLVDERMGLIGRSIKLLSPEEINEIARGIVGLYFEVESALHESEKTRI